WIQDVTDDRDRARRRILHLREIDPDHASARAGRHRQYRQPSAGRASEIDDSRTRAHQPVARDYLLDLERRARRQPHRSRLAVKSVVWFVSRHRSRASTLARFAARARAAILIAPARKF